MTTAAARKFTNGFVMIDRNVLNKLNLEPLEKITYITIASFCNAAGMAFPSYKRIAETANYSRKTAIRHVKKLIKRGLLLKQSRRTNRGDQTSNLYTLIIPNSPSLSLPLGTENHPNKKYHDQDHVVVESISPEIPKESKELTKNENSADGTISEKKKLISNQLLVNEKKLNFNNLLDKRSVDEVKQAVEVTLNYCNNAKIRNPFGFFRRALEQKWSLSTKKLNRYKKQYSKKQKQHPKITESRYTDKEKSLIAQLYRN